MILPNLQYMPQGVGAMGSVERVADKWVFLDGIRFLRYNVNTL